MILRKGGKYNISTLTPVNMHNWSHASKWTHIVGLKINKNSKHQHHIETTIASEINVASN